jgi:hypothetical protein
VRYVLVVQDIRRRNQRQLSRASIARNASWKHYATGRDSGTWSKSQVQPGIEWRPIENKPINPATMRY